MTALGEGQLREAAINTVATTANTARLRELTGTPVLAVVKADAYGHGAVRTARAALAGGAVMLGVTDLAEAFELRAAGITAPILSWLNVPGADYARAVAEHITLGVSSLAQLAEVAAVATSADPAVLHVKLETGLSRNGVSPADWSEMFRELVRLQADGRVVVDGIFSHLSNTTDDDDRAALSLFLTGVDEARSHGLNPRVRHIAATGAAIVLPEARLDMVRIGIGLHGLSPFPTRMSATELGLRPVMTLHAQVAAVRRVPAGTGLSYGYRYRTDRETTLALVPIGYADGVPRAASNRAPVRIAGQTFQVSGTVAMDQFIVDVGDATVAVGDEVVLFGDAITGAPTAEQWAESSDTINYEIVTRIGVRVPRREVSA